MSEGSILNERNEQQDTFLLPPDSQGGDALRDSTTATLPPSGTEEAVSSSRAARTGAQLVVEAYGRSVRKEYPRFSPDKLVFEYARFLVSFCILKIIFVFQERQSRFGADLEIPFDRKCPDVFLTRDHCLLTRTMLRLL